MTADASALDERFGIEGHVAVVAGPGGLPELIVRNSHAEARVALQGAHVVTYQPHGQSPVLWVSRQAVYTPGKAIRGGIPICWPWFGPHPTDPALPAHGFARVALWELLATEVAEGGATRLRLGLAATPQTHDLWPHDFSLLLELTIGPALSVALAVHNPGPAPFTYSGALHSYFTVGAIDAVAVAGLDGLTYIDQLDGGRRKLQQGEVTVSSEVDRIYLGAPATSRIHDRRLGRTIRIDSTGSASAVVWNPWVEKAQRLADFADDEYTGMICVETANAADDAVSVAPGATHTLGTTLSLEE